jgi:hypothetical protein
MKRVLSVVLAVGLVLTTFLSVNAETIEEQLLKMKEQRIKTYLYQAKVGDRNQKIDVLDKILGEFDEYKYSNRDKKLVELVVFLSEEGSTRKEFETIDLLMTFLKCDARLLWYSPNSVVIRPGTHLLIFWLMMTVTW